MATPLMTTNTSFQKQSKVIHRDYLNERNDIPEQWRRFFNEYTPPKRGSFIQYMPIVGLGNFYQKDEGAAPVFDSPSEGLPFFTKFSTYSLAVMISKEARREDPLDLIARAPKLLAKSARDSKDKITVAMYNFAFSGGKLLPDGQPLISANHLMDPQISPTGGVYSASGLTYSNSLGASQLTPEALMDGDTLMESLIDDRGKKDKRTLRKLIVPNNPVLIQIAQEIVGTPTAPYENLKKKNVQENRWEVLVNRDLSSQYNWFLQAGNGEPGEDCHALTVWIRWNDGDKEWGWNTFTDPMTGNYCIISSFRLAIGAWQWQGIVGSTGAGPIAG